MRMNLEGVTSLNASPIAVRRKFFKGKGQWRSISSALFLNEKSVRSTWNDSFDRTHSMLSLR
jgi:hypothetical protein